MSEYITIKINKDTRQRLKLLAVRNEETILELIDRLVEQEEKRVEHAASDTKLHIRTV